MKQLTLRIFTTCTITCCLIASLLSVAGCSKEKTLSPSNEDENYFVVKDNPNDPVDHAIYEFYHSTGIAGFCNDTIHRKRISDSAGQPRYTYITLSLSYNFYGKQTVKFKPVSNRSRIPALLTLMKQELLPRFPENFQVPSLFFVDSIWTVHPEQNIDIADGWTSFHGFNTVAVSVKDVEGMNADEQKMYVSSLLAGMAEKRLKRDEYGTLTNNFFSISRAVAKTMTSTDIYFGNPFVLLGINPVPPPPNLGFIKYYKNAFAIFIGAPNPVAPPGETEDLRSFLTAVFYYTPQEFESIYTGKTHVLKKFNAIREIARNAGFQVPG